MSHAEKCPVCEGSGKYKEKICHGCAGLGWIVIGFDCPQYPPVYPQYPWFPPYEITYGDHEWRTI
jgi:hypothetical protein